MPNKPDFEEFPPDIQTAFNSYPSPQLSPDFEARFWTRFEARRGRYRGFSGFWRRVWEIEIEGVAVWKLLFSTFSGGAACALLFGAFALFAMPQSAPIVSEIPAPETPETPRMAFDSRAFYAREWELEVAEPPKFAPRARQKSNPK